MIAPSYQRAQLWAPARSRLHTILLAAVIGATAFAAIASTRVIHEPSTSDRVELTQIVMTKAIYEGLPAWRAAHPRIACPRRLGAIMHSPLDAWGHAYEYTCAPGGFVMRSAGADGRFHTDDDIRVHS